MANNELSIMGRMNAYQGLMGYEGFSSLATQSALDHIARLRDISYELGKPEGLERCITVAEELQGRALSPREESALHYFLSNAWEKLRQLRSSKSSGSSVWDWEQPEIEKELVHLRRAIKREALRDMSTRHICQILSNMASLLNHVGRFSEAQEYWDRAISFMPAFTMARGKRGYALTHYAHVLYDKSHTEKFMKKARTDLAAAASNQELTLSTRGHFAKRLQWLDSRHPSSGASRDLALFKFSQASGPKEVSYRKWCLENRLFLNPLNDLGPYPAAMRDDVAVPATVSGGAARSYCHGLFNQMKQTYVSSRFMYYDAVSADGLHFSDRDVLLFDTMDYPAYSLSVEKTKAAFNLAYGIFDKLAFFLNHYLTLGIPDERLTFRSFWYASQQRSDGLRSEFADRRNWALRGLFWISKDLYEDLPGFNEPIEPDAHETSEARHNIDRRYLKLHEDFHSSEGSRQRLLIDSLAMSMSRSEFEARTLRIIKKVRSALMCLSFAVHIEEKARRGQSDAELPAISLSILDDSLKG